jgi:hypothetical protein
VANVRDGRGRDALLRGTIYGRDIQEYLTETVGREVLVRNSDYALDLFSASGWGVPMRGEVDGEARKGTIRLMHCFECEGIRS